MNTRTPKLLILSTALAGIFALSSVAVAHPSGGGQRGRGHGGVTAKMIRAMSSLELSEAQDVQLVRLRRALKKDHKAIKANRKADKQAMRAELGKANPNPQVFHSLIDKKMNARRAAAHSATDKVLAFFGALSPEQKQEVLRILDSGHGRGRGQGHKGKRHSH